MSNQDQAQTEIGFLFLADHPALDFLNTVPLVDGMLLDLFAADRHVIDWLAKAGWPLSEDAAKLKSGKLLETARKLRSVIRTAVERRMAGKKVDPAELNAFLSEVRSYEEVTLSKDGLALERRWKQRTAEEMLAPLVEAAADLLVHGDFGLVRGCESADCVLWFYDRTKSHHRRWCSMATCGNRHKVAEFRKRRQANAE
jgi:predicted RNA-binding Zn ribbon-like protein